MPQLYVNFLWIQGSKTDSSSPLDFKILSNYSHLSFIASAGTNTCSGINGVGRQSANGHTDSGADSPSGWWWQEHTRWQILGCLSSLRSWPATFIEVHWDLMQPGFGISSHCSVWAGATECSRCVSLAKPKWSMIQPFLNHGSSGKNQHTLLPWDGAVHSTGSLILPATKWKTMS